MPMSLIQLTKQEKMLLHDAVFAYRCRKQGESQLTDDSIFADIAFQAKEDYATLTEVQRKLYAAGLLTHWP